MLVGLETSAPWGELVHGTILHRDAEGLHGQSVVVATQDQFRAAAALIELDGLTRRIVLFPPDVALEHLRHVIETAEADAIVTDRPEIAAMESLTARVIRCAEKPAPVIAERGPEVETEWILPTSGTTGVPKLAVHTLASLAGSEWRSGASSASTVWATFYDMRRYGGLHIFLHAAFTGASMVLSSAQESTADFLVRAGAHGVTHISGTPSHWRRALMSPYADRIAPHYIRMSGEIVDQAILNQVQASYSQAKVAHTFASTEAGVGFNVNDGLMGFPAEILASNPLIEMRVKTGTLRIRSARTASRYLGANSPTLQGADGFVDTGDSLELRGGRYYFAGRRDGTINVGGFKVHPVEVEAVINRHAGVVMSLVKAKKNPITGALVVADVVMKPLLHEAGNSGSGKLERDLLEHCRAELAPHKVPATINIVSALKIGESGKLLRRHA
jgi:acyl-coenzyme A synthetase/AMP-(fatty) acid ligase